MEEYLIFAAIGGLLFLTLLVNSVSEAYEQNQREKRIKILRIKQGLDELSELLDQLKNCEISTEVRDLLLNEIMTRLQLIQRIDRHFRGIQALIEEAGEAEESAAQVNQDGFNTKDETVFKKKLIMLGRLIKLLNSNQWYSRTKPEKMAQMSKDAKLLRCEKVFQFYSSVASVEMEQKRYLNAKEHYNYILQALKGSGIPGNPRVVELIEQSEFMLEQLGEMFSKNAKKMTVQDEELNDSEETKEQSQAQTDNPQNTQKPSANSA